MKLGPVIWPAQDASQQGKHERVGRRPAAAAAFFSVLPCCAVLSAWLGPACWHGLTAPVSGFWDSSLHTVPADRHRPPLEDVKQTAGLLWSLQTHQEAGPQHSLWAPRHSRAQHCPAGTCILPRGGSQFMSGLTLVLTYSFCNNPLSPNSKLLVF